MKLDLFLQANYRENAGQCGFPHKDKVLSLCFVR